MEQHGLDVVLARQPFFNGLAPKYLELLAGCSTNVRFEDGEYLSREGAPADEFYLIREGRVAVEVASSERGAIMVQTIEPGAVFGYSWLIPPYRWTFDGRAVGPVFATALDGACLRGKCEEDRDLGYEMMKRFAQVMVDRLSATRLQMLDLYRADVP